MDAFNRYFSYVTDLDSAVTGWVKENPRKALGIALVAFFVAVWF
jgi:hypothetical protein